MIVEWVVERATTLMRAIFDLLPEDPTGLDGLDLTGAVHLYSWINTWAPASEAIGVMVLSVQVVVIISAVFVVVWLLKRLPFGLGGT